MGLFSSAKSTSGSGQKWAAPIAKAAASEVQNTYNANQGNLANMTGAVTGAVPGLTSNFQGWQPLTEQTQGYYSDVIGGKYLDPSSNPGLAGVLDRTRSDVTDATNSQFSMAGRYGSGAHTGVLADKLADAENQVLYQNYAQERANQGAAAGAATDAGASSLAQLLQAAGVGAELPYTGTNALSSGLASLFSGGVQKGAGLGQQLLASAGQVGAGAASAGAFSDPRLKSNIVKVDEFPDGLGVYEYDIFDRRERGVMADEVERLRPWAMGAEVEGFKTVHYGAL